VQRGLYRYLPPAIASNLWFGAIIGSVLAFGIVLLLSTAFSLTLGPTLDQNSANAAAAAGSSSPTNQDTSINISLYSNPLLAFASANQSKMVETITEGVSGDASQSITPQVGVTGTLSTTTPVTLLLLIPAIGLIIGGYLAASTDYAERRHFSVIRGASICLLYALLTLIVSLFASGTLAETATTSGITISVNGTITADAVSVFFKALLWGAVFGALGGYLRAWGFPELPHSRLYEGVRGA
jgi:hypothetical protein